MSPPLRALANTIPEGLPCASTSPAYICNRAGDPKPILANVITLLRSSPEWVGAVGFDEFSGRPTVLRPLPNELGASTFERRGLADPDVRATIEWVQRNGVAAASGVIHEALLKLCDETRAHPVKEYLEGLEWDQQARLETFLIAQAGVDDSGLNRAITSRWMIQAIARIYQPGCQADATLILEGDQGIGKSSLLRILFGQWHTETLPDLGSKDAMLQLRGVWCVELAELATLGKADQNRIKAFLTTNRDQYRPPYGRMTEWVPRSNVFAGTVNPGGGGYLKDATGARRFWPIEIRSPIDRDAIMEMRDQLWAEALYQYRAGQPWHLADATLITDVAEAQAKRFEGDPWEERITDFIRNRSSVTVVELLGKVLHIEAGRWTQGDQTRVAKILTHHGWIRKQRRVQGKPQWVYVPKMRAATGDGGGDRPAI